MQSTQQNDTIRNIAIIAHVDHGKTTLVDAMFQRSGVFRAGQEVAERVMDRLDLERERGITIEAKNCSIEWKGLRINIIDTPGHADFGGEVERALSMVDGAVLLVDAAEGPLPQTRFVLSKALKAGLSLIVVINKIDRQDARPLEVLDEVYDLLIDLDAGDHQLEFPILYAVGRDGVIKRSPDGEDEKLDLLLDTIVDHIPSPSVDMVGPFRMLVSDLGYDDYLGRLAVGKVYGGSVQANEALACIGPDGKAKPLRVTRLQSYRGLVLSDVTEAKAGEIIVLAGIEDVHIGDTVCSKDNPVPLKRITVDEPTVSMRFSVNNGPFSGKEGKIVQGTKIFERLEKETLTNVSMRVSRGDDRDSFIVQGRGEFQMVILIETMRREGFEFCVGRPHVIFHQENGKKMEPIEHLFIDCADPFTGVVTEKLSRRKGRMLNITSHENGRVRIEFSVPSRALIGYRDEFLTDTKGTGILNSYLSGYEEYRGDFTGRFTGSLVADREGTSVPYALFNLEARGTLFVVPKDPVYEGMIVGEHNRENDLNVNPTKTKKLSNMRASGKDDAVILTPVLPMTLERAVQFIREDELIEVTPKSIRLRKKELSAARRKIEDKRGQS
ncbi:translational GTPase TypA [Sediminispirochaeta bajacaliforniensis]|uniref:translational GTPase TypA n=1 Tax=Sediminispirochaeta bajacaliforniensis TaxID=148 RepID=UPI000364F390|nr:translational GTPase TypA [Sediminispirochaeta bajacaliforniensis]